MSVFRLNLVVYHHLQDKLCRRFKVYNSNDVLLAVPGTNVAFGSELAHLGDYSGVKSHKEAAVVFIISVKWTISSLFFWFCFTWFVLLLVSAPKVSRNRQVSVF